MLSRNHPDRIRIGRRSSLPDIHHQSGAGLDIGYDAGGNRGPDNVVLGVVLAGITVQTLHVDRMGSADERIKFGAAVNAG